MSLRRRIGKFLGVQTQSEAFLEIGEGVAKGLAKGLSDDYEGGQQMKVLDAVERLRILQNAVYPIEDAIDRQRANGNMSGKYALEIILEDLRKEEAELERKLAEVEI